jgi:hypothetical protein
MNKKIIIATVVIAGSGVLNAWQNKKPITPVILGAYIFVFILAILDMFGGQLSTLAGALAMLAVVYILIHEFPWTQIQDAINGGTVPLAKEGPPKGRHGT